MVFSLVNCLFMLLAPVVLETQCFSLQSVDTLYNKPLILMSAEPDHILSTFLTPRTLTAPPLVGLSGTPRAGEGSSLPRYQQ